jgi:hypothetical protein
MHIQRMGFLYKLYLSTVISGIEIYAFYRTANHGITRRT